MLSNTSPLNDCYNTSWAFLPIYLYVVLCPFPSFPGVGGLLLYYRDKLGARSVEPKLAPTMLKAD